jgi:hypothetical protein
MKPFIEVCCDWDGDSYAAEIVREMKLRGEIKAEGWKECVIRLTMDVRNGLARLVKMALTLENHILVGDAIYFHLSYIVTWPL